MNHECHINNNNNQKLKVYTKFFSESIIGI